MSTNTTTTSFDLPPPPFPIQHHHQPPPQTSKSQLYYEQQRELVNSQTLIPPISLLPSETEEMEFSSDGGGDGSGGGGNDVELLSKTLHVEHGLFYYDLEENPRGRYLKISEKTSATRSTIIVPFNGIAWFFDIFNNLWMRCKITKIPSWVYS
ncbi:hypothetical protein QVD17_19433 [Tagetes erecta]|uniref:Uncharacterized protein n=1 Tax=Tagetes erecta TaxID=13708 RepID=A0AAD8KMA8_TARER|nr:hypothetical protein QVD17_19433 [Tagetes erecta]